MKAQKIIHLLLWCVVCWLFSSCEYIHNLMDNDEIITQNQTIGIINNIVVDAPVHLVLHNNESVEAYIKGSNHLLENLSITSSDGILYIDHSKKNFIQKSKLIELGISAKYLNRITTNMAFELSAPEAIKANHFTMVVNGGAKFAEIELELDCQNLSLHVYGNNNIGNFLLEGKATQSNFTLEGSVNIDAIGLSCENSNITHKSIGSCKVSPALKLNVKTYSSGNTYYSGNPEIQHEFIKVPYLNCSGELIKLD